MSLSKRNKKLILLFVSIGIVLIVVKLLYWFIVVVNLPTIDTVITVSAIVALLGVFGTIALVAIMGTIDGGGNSSRIKTTGGYQPHSSKLRRSSSLEVGRPSTGPRVRPPGQR